MALNQLYACYFSSLSFGSGLHSKSLTANHQLGGILRGQSILRFQAGLPIFLEQDRQLVITCLLLCRSVGHFRVGYSINNHVLLWRLLLLELLQGSYVAVSGWRLLLKFASLTFPQELILFITFLVVLQWRRCPKILSRLIINLFKLLV